METIELIRMGRQAAKDGKPSKSNPFKDGTKDHYFWYVGWSDYGEYIG
jgi:hypothetical protein